MTTMEPLGGTSFTEDELSIMRIICRVAESSHKKECVVELDELLRMTGWGEERVLRAVRSLGDKTDLVDEIEAIGDA